MFTQDQHLYSHPSRSLQIRSQSQDQQGKKRNKNKNKSEKSQAPTNGASFPLLFFCDKPVERRYGKSNMVNNFFFDFS